MIITNNLKIFGGKMSLKFMGLQMNICFHNDNPIKIIIKISLPIQVCRSPLPNPNCPMYTKDIKIVTL